MAIYSRGSVLWIDCKHKGLRHREPVGSSIEEAKRREAEVLLILRSGRLPDRAGKTRGTIEEATEIAFRTKWKDNKDIAGPTQRCKLMQDFFGSKNLNEFTESDVRKLVVKLHGDGLKEPTIRRYLANLQVLFKCAHNAGLMRQPMVVKSVKAELSEASPREFILSDELKDKVISYMFSHSSTYGHYTRALFLTGARRGELLALQWDDIKSDCIVFRAANTKSRHQKVLPLSDSLRVMFDILPRTCDQVFPIAKYAYAYYWKKMRRELGLPKELVPHSIRHTVATKLVKSCPLPVASKFLGHRNITTTMRYVHINTDDLRQCTEVL